MSQKTAQLLNSRRLRIQKLKEMIETNPEKPLTEIIAKFCVEQGTREKTANSYYELLVKAKEIKPNEPKKQ